MHSAVSNRSSEAVGCVFNSSTDLVAKSRSVTHAQIGATSMWAVAAYFAETGHCSIERMRKELRNAFS
jgi:hypothetical protein